MHNSNTFREMHPRGRMSAAQAHNSIQFHMVSDPTTIRLQWRGQRSKRRCRNAQVTILAAGHQEGVSSNGVTQQHAHVDNKNVVILGGTGRVGSSTAQALLEWAPNLKVVLSSRSKDSWSAAVSKRPALQGTEFVQCDINNKDAVQHLITCVSWAFLFNYL